MTGDATRLDALADRYALEGEIDHGGIATVYLATDLKHKRKVALKVIRSELTSVVGAQRRGAQARGWHLHSRGGLIGISSAQFSRS